MCPEASWGQLADRLLTIPRLPAGHPTAPLARLDRSNLRVRSTPRRAAGPAVAVSGPVGIAVGAGAARGNPGDDWIGWSTGQICHDWLVRTLRRQGAEPCVVHTASEHSAQLALVAAGLGVAVIPAAGPRTRTTVSPVRTDRPTTDTPHLRPLASQCGRPPRNRRHPRRATAALRIRHVTAPASAWCQRHETAHQLLVTVSACW
jgi:hypothetical protein